MSKPTILLLSIVYFASILIVGIFGMQVMSFNNVNYIESITINVQDVEFSNGKPPIIIKEEEVLDDGIPYMKYTVVFEYEKDLSISIKPIVVAQDPTLDPTDKTLNVSSNNTTSVYENGIFTVKTIGVVTFTFNSQDASNKKMLVVIYPI